MVHKRIVFSEDFPILHGQTSLPLVTIFSPVDTINASVDFHIHHFSSPDLPTAFYKPLA